MSCHLYYSQSMLMICYALWKSLTSDVILVIGQVTIASQFSHRYLIIAKNEKYNRTKLFCINWLWLKCNFSLQISRKYQQDFSSIQYFMVKLGHFCIWPLLGNFSNNNLLYTTVMYILLKLAELSALMNCLEHYWLLFKIHCSKNLREQIC